MDLALTVHCCNKGITLCCITHPYLQGTDLLCNTCSGQATVTLLLLAHTLQSCDQIVALLSVRLERTVCAERGAVSVCRDGTSTHTLVFCAKDLENFWSASAYQQDDPNVCLDLIASIVNTISSLDSI